MTEQDFSHLQRSSSCKKDNTICCWAICQDKYVAMLTVLSTHKVKDLETADKTGYSLCQPIQKPWLEIITKTSERGVFEALDAVAYGLKNGDKTIFAVFLV